MQLAPWSIRGKENQDLRPPSGCPEDSDSSVKYSDPLDVSKTWILLGVSKTQAPGCLENVSFRFLSLKLTKTALKEIMALRSNLTLRHTTQKTSWVTSYFKSFQKEEWNLFVCSHTFSYKIKFLTNSKRVWVACVRGRIYFNLRLILISDSLIFYVMKEIKNLKKWIL